MSVSYSHCGYSLQASKKFATPLLPILSIYFPNIHHNAKIPALSRSSGLSLIAHFQHQILYALLFPSIHLDILEFNPRNLLN
jgi:hypothetical protein